MIEKYTDGLSEILRADNRLAVPRAARPEGMIIGYQPEEFSDNPYTLFFPV